MLNAHAAWLEPHQALEPQSDNQLFDRELVKPGLSVLRSYGECQHQMC